MSAKPEQRAWVANFGKNLIKKVELKIGDEIIYDSDKDLLYNYNSFYNNYKNMIGDVQKDKDKDKEQEMWRQRYIQKKDEYLRLKAEMINQKEEKYKQKQEIFKQNEYSGLIVEMEEQLNKNSSEFYNKKSDENKDFIFSKNPEDIFINL
jgi:hypothetical protein